MKIREIGQSGIKTTALGIGTWAAGADNMWQAPDDDLAIEAIQTAVRSGIRLIDTAPAYGLGHAEQLIGRALAESEIKREDVILQSKCGVTWHVKEGSNRFERRGKTVVRNLTPESIQLSLDDTLKNLRTDYLDIYITHWQSVDEFPVPIKDTMGKLMDLKRQGIIRAIGISNVTPRHLLEYLDYGEVDLVQEKYSMLDRRNVEDNLLPLCEKFNITLQAYTPLEHGLLTGAITMATEIPEGDVRNRNAWYRPENRIQVVETLEKWAPLTVKYNCTISQLVIAWTLDRSEKMSVLCGVRRPKHAEANAAAGAVELEKADWEAMYQDIKKLALK